MTLTLPDPLLQRWLGFALALPGSALVPASRAGDRLWEQEKLTENALRNFLRPPARCCPKPLAEDWRAYAAAPGEIDLLFCEYDAAGLHVHVRRGRSFLMVSLDLDGETLLHRDRLEKLLHEHVLVDLDLGQANYRRTWAFDLPDEIDSRGSARLFSTRGARPIPEIMQNDRADILVWNRAVHFVFYPLPDKIVGLLPDDTWFSPKARAALRGEDPAGP